MDRMISISEAGRKIKKALEELERERQVQNIN